jgi:Carboxypeptidase regulatory-like domain/TonB dependent receptor
MKQAFCKNAILALLVLLVAALGAFAQSLERGAVHGFVYDTSGSAIVGAKVSITNPSTGLKREVSTDADGGYTFEALNPGEFNLVVDAPGFATYNVKQIVVNVGGSLALDIHMKLKTAEQSITVTAEAAGIVDTSTAGISQLLNSESVSNLPLPGRDYRDLAQLTPSAQVTTGLRGGLRLGGQQSDYSGLTIDGADNYNNSFGEFFGSLETKNFTIPLDAVQEFQVVTNGFAPEFGRSTGGLINLVTKSGTNDIHGTGFYSYRGDKLTADDALGVASSITRQQQFGGTVGFPIRKDKQFLFLAAQIQRQFGPLVTKFGSNVSGIAVPELGIADLGALEGAHTQFQNLYSVLGHYDWQMTSNNHFSIRSFFTRNHTDGFTGGRGQNEIQAAFDNTENFHNQGLSTAFGLVSVLGAHKVNELRLGINAETRPRHPNGTLPEVQINGTGIFGQRFFLPINGDNSKLQAQDNFSYTFGKHDMKWGGDVDVFQDRKDVFAGWSAGSYSFGSLADFGATAADQQNNMKSCGHPRCPFGFIQGFGLNGLSTVQAGTLFPNYQTGVGLYWQDKWQVTPRFTVTYGVRWDNSWNPQPQSDIPGRQVYVGVGAASHLVPAPKRIPNDHGQIGPRIGAIWNIGSTARPTIIRAAWGLYYAQSPTIFLPTGGASKGATLFCFFTPGCLPPGGFAHLYPSTLQSNDPLFAFIGNPGINYVDPDFRNPRVSNLTIGVEHDLGHSWMASATYAYVHGTRLRTGGFSTTQWSRNVIVDHVDSFGRSILVPGGFGPALQDTTIGQAAELGSFGHSNYHEFVASVNKRFSSHFQFFANYTFSKNMDNASSERDSSTFFGPQDPFNLNLDYGRSGLDITQQFKFAGVYELPWGVTFSALGTAHSGLAYPGYITVDVNGDGVSNQGFGSNDRPVVQLGSGKPFLLDRYPGRQPSFFQSDLRLNKDFAFRERYHLQVLADFYNFTNRGNLFSNPDVSAFVTYNCVGSAPTQTCTPLTALPKPGDIGPSGQPYRKLDQISPGSTPFAAQFGAKIIF